MSKGLIRSMSRKGTRKSKKPPVAAKAAPLTDPSCCERCGALFTRQAWRRAGKRSVDLLARVEWTVCPACRQAERGEYFGRVIIAGAFAAAHEPEIRQRIRNISDRARFTQPERRVVSAERSRNVLEILTTSQKLAHRIVRELKKQYHGRASYAWSPDDGSLYAKWERG
ncbi:MAG: hypothetical protein HY270_04155 [Deltaproteobacteria bacterium]|nr:hypothetical protein [Deltaproteobacteria bacterium]